MATKLSKQGVPILPNSSMKHVHKHVPITYTARDGSQMTRMVCYCGDVQAAEAKTGAQDSWAWPDGTS